jgi:hypothetical protein
LKISVQPGGLITEVEAVVHVPELPSNGPYPIERR